MDRQRLISHSCAETEEIGKKLGKLLKGGEVIAFTGSMGAGKTAFTRGIMDELGAGDAVSSPTFAIVNEYEGRLTVEHFDMYRIESWDDLYSTGFFDYLDTNRVLIIEWSENIENALPENAIHIDIAHGQSEYDRTITIEGLKGRL